MDIGCTFLSTYSTDQITEVIVEKVPEGVEEDQKEYAGKYEEENKGRFIPQVIITDLLKQETATNLLNLDQHIAECIKDKKITIKLSDYDNETSDSTVIDLAVTYL